MNRRHHKKSGNPPVAGSRFLPICWNCRGFLFAPRCGGANRHNSLHRIEFLYRISVRGRRRKKRESFGILRKLAVSCQCTNDKEPASKPGILHISLGITMRPGESALRINPTFFICTPAVFSLCVILTRMTMRRYETIYNGKGGDANGISECLRVV